MQVTQLSLLDHKKHIVLEQNKDLPKTYKGLYAMHKYWSKKPYNLVANYIERFSSPGDIVLDSFCGSGVTVIESVRLKRRAVGIDINPIAVSITEMGLMSVDIKQLKQHFYDLRQALEPLVAKLYRTECLKCGNPDALITHTIWKDETPQEVWYTCAQCKTRKDVRPASEIDEKAASSPVEPPRWYPTDLLMPNSRINAKKGMRVSDLFTNRALIVLSTLFERISQIQDKNIKSVMESCFSGALPQASKLVFVIRRRGKTTGDIEDGKAEVGSWVIGYWTPPEHFESNAWRCFENRFKRIVRGKEEVNAVIPSSVAKCSDFEDLSRVQEGYWVDVGTATDLAIPDDAIDYAFIDPPHGNRIPYLELSLIWNAWFKAKGNWENEIIVSEAKDRQKDVVDYKNRLLMAFSELWRVLKANKFISVAFNSLDDETWLSLLNACLEVGFEVSEIKPLAYSARSVVQDNRKNALKTDFVITCKKQVPKKAATIKYNRKYEDVSDEIAAYLAQSVDGAETYQLLNHLFIINIPTGKIYRISQILKILDNEFAFNNGRWYPKAEFAGKLNGS